MLQHVQTKREIAEQLEAAGVRPQKRFGQNFLIDGNLMRRLAGSAELEPTDTIVEVGAGTGGLTDLLVDAVTRIIVVEIDNTLFDILSERFADRSKVRLLHGDVLDGKHKLLSSLDQALRDLEGAPGCTKLVANLPYQIATPLIMNLMLNYPHVSRFCFTVQAEVGDRICSPAGCKSYGPLSIVSQTLCNTSVVSRLPPSAFWPPPSIDSVMLRMDVSPSPFENVSAVHEFANLVRRTFEHRRKTLRSALGYFLEVRQVDAVCDAVDSKRRPESFSVEEWKMIHDIVRGHRMN